MVGKCSNPACGKPFHYLHEGRLFRRERDPGWDAAADPDANSVEYFWLCGECAKTATLRLDERGEINVEKLVANLGDEAIETAVISQHNGMLLRSVAITRRKLAESLRLRRGPTRLSS